MATVLIVYITGLIITFLFDLAMDLTIKGNKFNIRWILGMAFSCTCWFFVVPTNLIMVLYLRSKGKYTFKRC